jgi:hypothetical protein
MEEEMDRNDTFWAKPLTVRLQTGLTRTFHSVEEAIDFMENEWPTRFGTHHRRASDLFRSARMRLVSRELPGRLSFPPALSRGCRS